MLTLYDFPESGNSYKIRLLLNLLDKPYKSIKMDGFKGASRTPEFLEKNVDGRLPFLETEDGKGIAESNAILYYLAQNTRYFSDDINEQTEILRWMFFEQNRIVATIAVVRFCMLYLTEEKRDKHFEDVLRKRGLGALHVMDDHLENNDFFALRRFTIADIALYPYTSVAGEAGVALSGFSNIQTWINRIEAEPGFIPFEY